MKHAVWLIAACTAACAAPAAEAPETTSTAQAAFAAERPDDAERPQRDREARPEEAEPEARPAPEPEPHPVPREAVVLRLLWGQLPGALPAAREVDLQRVRRALPRPADGARLTEWSGRVTGHGVAVQVVDTVRFEPNDHYRGCPLDARCETAGWKTVTGPSHDGIILRFIPGPQPRGVVFDVGPFEGVAVPYDQLADLDGLVDLRDRAGNQISVTAVSVAEGCPAGFVEGVWLGSAANQGGYVGLWYGWRGRRGGSMQGVYVPHPGTLGYGVFRDLEGRDIAFSEGTYGAHDFELTGRDALGEPIGAIGGHYGPGFFHGAWAADCDPDRPEPRPVRALRAAD